MCCVVLYCCYLFFSFFLLCLVLLLSDIIIKQRNWKQGRRLFQSHITLLSLNGKLVFGTVIVEYANSYEPSKLSIWSFGVWRSHQSCVFLKFKDGIGRRFYHGGSIFRSIMDQSLYTVWLHEWFRFHILDIETWQLHITLLW